MKKHGVQRIIVEPTADTNPDRYREFVRSLSKFFTIHKESFLPTKTILVNLTKPEKEIFQSFSEAKRRAVRRAQKHGVVIKESSNINDLIFIKSKSAGMFGGITTYGIDKLWNLFYPKHATILLAYAPSSRSVSSRGNVSDRSDPCLAGRQVYNKDCFSRHWRDRNDKELLSGVLLLFWEQTAYYWIAGATKKGKRLFAPTLLVWEALKISKKRRCRQFDFVGVLDERMPNQFKSWKGFTKFKEGFGGKEIYYPIAALNGYPKIRTTVF